MINSVIRNLNIMWLSAQSYVAHLLVKWDLLHHAQSICSKVAVFLLPLCVVVGYCLLWLTLLVPMLLITLALSFVWLLAYLVEAVGRESTKLLVAALDYIESRFTSFSVRVGVRIKDLFRYWGRW